MNDERFIVELDDTPLHDAPLYMAVGRGWRGLSRETPVKNASLAVIAAALLAMPFHVLSQEPTTAAQSSPSGPADPSIGKWIGEWQISGRYGSWSMEMEVGVESDQLTGQVRSTGSPGCSLEWAKLTGVRKGEKIFAQYNLGGRCGKVDLIYSINDEGRVMTGTWSSEYPGYGTFRLTK